MCGVLETLQKIADDAAIGGDNQRLVEELIHTINENYVWHTAVLA
jgi:hypothetical protein